MQLINEKIVGLPEFKDLDFDFLYAELINILNKNRQVIDELSQLKTPSWDSFCYELDVIANDLDVFWSPIRHLNSVMNSDKSRDLYNKGIKLISEYSTELGQNQRIYQNYQKIINSNQFNDCSISQKKVIKDKIISFQLNGVALDKDKKDLFKDIVLRLNKLTTQFEENILDCTSSWSKSFEDDSLLKGLPPHTLDAAKKRAEDDSAKYLLNLEFPTYYAVSTYAENRELRKEFYEAFVTRASISTSHNVEYSNDKILAEIVNLRTKKAKLLEFESYADLSTYTKMVKNPEKVSEFLNELLDKTKLLAKHDYSSLEKFALSQDGIDDLQAWDIAYYSNKQKKALFDISDIELKPYFPASKVILGMFEIVKRLYGIEVSLQTDVQAWHDDVQFYLIKDDKSKVRGGFYLDLFARKNKRAGAWMDECICRMKHKENIQLPVAYLTCNLTPPIGDSTALLTHTEVITLFHEFGHGLHHMLTQIDYRDVSGINGVEWDAVELPSQFMENWCWETVSLDLISEHYESADDLPNHLIEKMIKSKNFQSAMQMVRQIEFALFDIELYKNTQTLDIQEVQTILNGIRNKVSVINTPEFNRFQNSFSHIFSGGYAAGYFSYKWAEVLSADVFDRFENEGLLNHQTGISFLNTILEKGGSEPSLSLFERFRGRKPAMDALLRHNGLEQTNL